MGHKYDVILFGATGFTGTLVAEQLRDHSEGIKWAIAGRNETKMKELLNNLNIDINKVDNLVIDSAKKSERLDAIVKSTRLVLTTVGPFLLYGEALFESCATHGTHYIDSTGEFPFVADMIVKYEKLAKSTGSI